MKIIRILKEVNNYFFLWKTIRKARKQEKWNQHKLRNGYLGTIYTVINLPIEVYESEEIYYKTYVLEQMAPINDYLASLNLQEIITPEIKDLSQPEQGVFAYLIKYKPLFRDLVWTWLLKWLFISSIIWWIQYRFKLLTKTYNILEDVIVWLF